MNAHKIASVTHLSPEPQGGYGPDAPVKITYVNGRPDGYSHWGSDVGGGGVLAWRAENGDQAATAYQAPAVNSADVNAERDRRIRAGKTFVVTGYGTIAVDGTPVTQLNLLALKDTARDLKAAGVVAPVIPYRDAGNVTHMLTADQMIELVNKGKTYVQAAYSASWVIKNGGDIPADYTDDSHWPS